MPDLHLPSFIAGAIVGPFLWAGAAFAFVIVLAVLADILDALGAR